MRLLCSGASQTGLVRQNNEDAFLIRTAGQSGLFLVADGIGGREHGELVSAMLRDRYDQWWQERSSQISGMTFPGAIEELKQVLLQVNREVVERFGPLNAGSTLALLLLTGRNCLYLSAGDSRIYRARRLSFQQMTKDDTVENSVKAPEQMERADLGKLMGAVGIREKPEFSVRTDVLQRGDRFFLCSDGAYRFLAPGRMGRRISRGWPDPDRLIEELSKEIERNGAGDNYTMIYVRAASL